MREKKVRCKMLPDPQLEGEEGMFCVQLNPAGYCFSLKGELWDKIEATQLSHSCFLSTCILGAKCGQNMLRMSE